MVFFIVKVYDELYVNYVMKVMLGYNKVKDFNFQLKCEGYVIKILVFSYEKFLDVKKELGLEMKFIGEVICFIKDLKDLYFFKIYLECNMYFFK